VAFLYATRKNKWSKKVFSTEEKTIVLESAKPFDNSTCHSLVSIASAYTSVILLTIFSNRILRVMTGLVLVATGPSSLDSSSEFGL